MALIYKSASILRTISLGLLTIFGFVSVFFLGAPKLWTGSVGIFGTDTAHADTPHSCQGDPPDSCGCSGCACGGAGGSGCGGCNCDCGSCANGNA